MSQEPTAEEMELRERHVCWMARLLRASRTPNQTSRSLTNRIAVELPTSWGSRLPEQTSVTAVTVVTNFVPLWNHDQGKPTFFAFFALCFFSDMAICVATSSFPSRTTSTALSLPLPFPPLLDLSPNVPSFSPSTCAPPSLESLPSSSEPAPSRRRIRSIPLRTNLSSRVSARCFALVGASGFWPSDAEERREAEVLVLGASAASRCIVLSRASDLSFFAWARIVC